MKTNKWLLALTMLTFGLSGNSNGFQGKPDDIKLAGNYHYNAEVLVRVCKAVENVNIDGNYG